MKYKEDKLSKREIVWMIWGFFGSCIVGSLLISNDLNYLTGNAVLETSANFISTGFTIFGITFIAFLFAVGIANFIWWKIWKEN